MVLAVIHIQTKNESKLLDGFLSFNACWKVPQMTFWWKAWKINKNTSITTGWLSRNLNCKAVRLLFLVVVDQLESNKWLVLTRIECIHNLNEFIKASIQFGIIICVKICWRHWTIVGYKKKPQVVSYIRMNLHSHYTVCNRNVYDVWRQLCRVKSVIVLCQIYQPQHPLLKISWLEKYLQCGGMCKIWPAVNFLFDVICFTSSLDNMRNSE